MSGIFFSKGTINKNPSAISLAKGSYGLSIGYRESSGSLNYIR